MLLLLLLAFLVPKIFWRKHMFGPDVFLIFVVIILFYFLPLLYFFICWVEAVFFSTVPWNSTLGNAIEASTERERTHFKKRGCSEDNNPVKLNPVQTLNLMALFWLTLETCCGCRGVCCRQGKSEQMESWGICREMERIFWIAFASGVKLQAN